MTKREAKKKAHAIAAVLLKENIEVEALSSFSSFGTFINEDTQRLEDALREISMQHERQSGYDPLD